MTSDDDDRMMTVDRMAYIWLVLLVLPAFCTVAIAQDEAARTSPSELLGNPGLFDGKPITISGTVFNLREGGPAAGKGYYTFDLSDGTEAVRVVAMGKARCKVGRTTVDGTYERVKQQITATRVRCR